MAELYSQVSSPQQCLRVLVHAEVSFMRIGMSLAVSADPNLYLAGEAATLQEADAFASRSILQVILLDMQRQLGDGITFMLRWKDIQPSLRFVCFMDSVNSRQASRAIAAGAYCVLPFSAEAADVCAVVRGELRGFPHRAKLEVDGFGRRSKYELGDDLTGREMDVLKLIATGRANAEISTQLGISCATVKFHVTSVLQKLNCTNRTEAMLEAFRKGIILR